MALRSRRRTVIVFVEKWCWFCPRINDSYGMRPTHSYQSPLRYRLLVFEEGSPPAMEVHQSRADPRRLVVSAIRVESAYGQSRPVTSKERGQ
jgi:hypothetical protein